MADQLSQLLEQYVFSVAGRIIGDVDEEEQTQLIQLIHAIGSGDPPIAIERALKSIQPIKTEWQQELDKPVNLDSVHLQWRIGIIRQQIRRDELYITRLENALYATQQHYEFGQTLLNNDRRQSIWRCLISQYQQYLRQARESQQLAMDQLVRLSK